MGVIGSLVDIENDLSSYVVSQSLDIGYDGKISKTSFNVSRKIKAVIIDEETYMHINWIIGHGVYGYYRSGSYSASTITVAEENTALSLTYEITNWNIRNLTFIIEITVSEKTLSFAITNTYYTSGEHKYFNPKLKILY